MTGGSGQDHWYVICLASVTVSSGATLTGCIRLREVSSCAARLHRASPMQRDERTLVAFDSAR